MAAKERIFELLKTRVGQFVSLQEIRDVAQTIDFTRTLRALRQEGWDLELRRDKGTVWYRLHSLTRRKGKSRIPIDKKTRYRILMRDNSACQRCGRTPAEGVKLQVDHKLPVEWGGTNDDDNLWTLCRECNEGKKAFFSDFKSDEMRRVCALPTGTSRLIEFVQMNYHKALPATTLAIVSRIRDWTREVRKLRELGYFEYDYDRKKQTYTFRPK